MLSEHISNATPSQLEALRRRQKFYQSVNKSENQKNCASTQATQLHHAYVDEEPVVVVSPPSQPIKARYFPGNAKSVIKIICKGCGHYFAVDYEELISKSRTARIVKARQVAFLITKEVAGWSLPEIGRRFGGKDHTTILHGIRKIERLRTKDAEFDDKVERLKAAVIDAIRSDYPEFSIPGERQPDVPEQQGSGQGTVTFA